MFSSVNNYIIEVITRYLMIIRINFCAYIYLLSTIICLSISLSTGKSLKSYYILIFQIVIQPFSKINKAFKKENFIAV